MIQLYTLFQILLPYRSLQNIQCGALCYAVGHCWFSVLLVVVCICSSSPIHPLPARLPVGDCKCAFNVSVSSCSVNKFVCIIFLDSTSKRYAICLCLAISLSVIASRSTHVAAADGIISLFSWLSRIPLYVYMCVYIYTYIYLTSFIMCVYMYIYTHIFSAV